jgi:type II secretory pathway component GspD/PulD (secretin)
MRYRQSCYLIALLVLSLIAAACSSRAYGRGERAARIGNWDAAVDEYRRAVQDDPDRADYQIALERAMINASLAHLDQARVFEARGQLEEALREYRRASEYDPTNRQIAGKAVEMERRLRELAEAQPPSATIQQLQQAARQTPEPLLNPASREPADWIYNNASLRDILTSMGMATGINVTFERDYQDRTYSITLRGATFEEALTHILQSNVMFYKVINQNTIMIIPDTAQKRAAYEEQVIRTFFISHGDATELTTILNGIIRLPQLAVTPAIVPNKTNNTITVRASANVMAIIERIIEQNDNPRAEIVIDVQILEVNRNRAKQFGIELSEFAVRTAFSPELDPRGGDQNSPALTPQPFNLNSVTRGISTADFYLSVPSAVVRFLETDEQTRLIAKPQLRGAEGQQITLNLGDQIPVPTTTFTPIAGGGANVNPLVSFQYRDVGVNVTMTPRVTFEGDIILDITVENSTLGGNVTVADQSLPSFGSRRVQTRLRLRDGESNLLAGLLREEDRRAIRGIPGIVNLPVLRSLFASNNNRIDQTDIVMLLTPRIVRTQELGLAEVSPIFIGTQQSLGLTGAPALIAPPDAQPATVPAAPSTPPGGVIVVPPGSSPVPGTTTVPAAPAQPTPAPAVPPAGGAAIPPPASVPPAPAAGAPPAATTAVAAGGQVLLSPPGTDFRVGGGPYTVPISISGAQQVSSIALTVTFNPAALRVRSVQEGSFMRTGGSAATFTQQVDATTGRIDIVIVRTGDTTGVAGTGLLAAVLFDAVGGGAANLTITGSATSPRGTPVALQFAGPPAVTVR